jgi:hypothetical protein
MAEMIFDTCQLLGGYVWCSVVRNLIVERWQTFFSDPSILRYYNYFGTLCICVGNYVDLFYKYKY